MPINPSGTPWPLPAIDIPSTYCNAPSDLEAVVENDIVKLKWKSPHDNDGFSVLYWTGSSIPVELTVFGSSVEIQLAAETVFHWSVRTMCNRLTNRGSAIVQGLPFATGKESILCPVIDISNALVIKSGSIVRVQWTPVTGIVNYIIELRQVGSKMMGPVLNTPTAFINFQTLVPNTKYMWRVKPDCVLSNFSEWAEFESGAGNTCPPPVLTAVTGTNNAMVYWKEGNNQSNYRIYVDGSLVSDQHAVNLITLSFLKPATAYTVIVIGLCPDGMSDMAVLEITTAEEDIPNPTNAGILITAQSNAIIQWSPAPNIDSQLLFINGTKIELDNITQSFNLNNQSPYTLINVLIKSVRGGKLSSGTFIEKQVPGYCPAVEGLQVIAFTHNSIRIGWRLQSGVSYYKIGYKKQSDTEYIEFNSQATSHLFEALKPNTAYVFQVVSNCLNGTAPAITIGHTTAVSPLCPAMVIGVASNIDIDSFEVAFKAQGGVDAPWGNYALKVINPDTEETFSFDGKLSPIKATGLDPNTEYTVFVENACDGDPSASSSIVVNTLPVCAPPTNLTAGLTSSNTVLNIAWNTVLGAAGYKIKYKLVGTIEWTELPQQSPIFKTITGVTPGIYDVIVSSVFGSGRECANRIISAAPKVLNLVNESTGKFGKFYWDKIEGAAFYEVLLVSVSDSNIVRVLTEKAEIQLEQSINYSTSVRAYNGIAFGPFSDASVFNSGAFVYEDANECAAPEFKAYSQDSNVNDPATAVGSKLDIVVKISDYNNRLKYKVDIVAKAGLVPIASAIFEILQPNFLGEASFNKLPFGEYVAKVTTFTSNEKYCEGCHDVYSAIITPVDGMESSNVLTTSFTVCWNKVDNTAGYMVFLDNELITITKDLCYNFSGLVASTKYIVQVRNKGGECLFSDETAIEVTTPAEDPVEV